MSLKPTLDLVQSGPAAFTAGAGGNGVALLNAALDLGEAGASADSSLSPPGAPETAKKPTLCPPP